MWPVAMTPILPLRMKHPRSEDVPMSFADGCIVRLAERHARGVVFTLDNDFTVYRKNGRQVIPALAPAS